MFCQFWDINFCTNFCTNISWSKTFVIFPSVPGSPPCEHSTSHELHSPQNMLHDDSPEGMIGTNSSESSGFGFG